MTAMKPIYYYRANQIMLALTLGAFCLKLQMTALYLRLTEQSVLTLSSKNNFVFIHSFLFPQKLQNETLNAQSSHKVLGNLSLCFWIPPPKEGKCLTGYHQRFKIPVSCNRQLE
jgi:hypothetical protein